MTQPVMDTLRLSKRLREAGMDGEQADGMARALSTELDEHVAVRKDLNAGFEGIRSEMALMRAQLDAKIDLVRSDLSARIDALDSKLNVLGLGVGLALAFLTLLVGVVAVGVYREPEAVPAPPTAPVVIPMWQPAPAVPAATPNGNGGTAPNDSP